MALTEIKTSGIADDAVTTDKLANAINTARDANTAKVSLADNAVTLAKMAGGTDGQIITYDASGDPVAVGPGTDGQVLTSTGAGSPPAFETLPTSGATLSGSTDNTVVTVTGSNAMQGESNVRIDSSGRLLVGSSDGTDYTDASADDLIIGSTSAGKNDGITILSGTGQNGSLAFADSGGGTRGLVGYVHNGDYLRFHTAGTLRARIDSDGLKFGSDTGANNALDDYEYGTWVIAATAENGTVTLASNVNEGAYVKVGRLVHVSVRVNISAVSGQSGYLRLSLPFATSNTGPDQSWASIFPLYTSHVNLPNDAISTMGEPWQNTAYVNFMVQYDAGLWTAVNCNAITASSHEYIAFTTTYITDS